MELVEKVAIVTGSSRGIGYGIASALSRVGAKVIISGREEETCRSAVETITQDGGSSIYVTIDIARSGEVERLVEAALEAFGKVFRAISPKMPHAAPCRIYSEAGFSL